MKRMQSKKSLDEGEDFSKLVKEKSTGQKSNSNDGKVTFHSHTSSVPEEVKEASFKLSNGDIGDYSGKESYDKTNELLYS